MFGGLGYMNKFGSSMFGLVSRGSLQSCIFTCFQNTFGSDQCSASLMQKFGKSRVNSDSHKNTR